MSYKQKAFSSFVVCFFSGELAGDGDGREHDSVGLSIWCMLNLLVGNLLHMKVSC